MRLGFQSDAHGNIYREFAPVTYYNGLSINGLGATPQQMTAVIGTAGSMIPVAGPFIAALASIATVIESMFQGCGQTCVQTSNAANQASDLITQALHKYMDAPVHYASMRQAYLALFDNTWAKLSQICSNPQFGPAGQRCISDRQQGACTWKASPGGWNQGADGKWAYTWAGASGSGDTCWNWFTGMRDPVADDPTVVPDPVMSPGVETGQGQTGPGQTPGQATGQPASGSGVNIPMPLLLGGAALLILAVAMGNK